MQPRRYQQEIIAAVEAGWAEARRQLVVVPTGGGKTIIFSFLAKRMLPKRTLILAHREELVDQAVQKLAKAAGIFAAREKAEHKASLSSEVVVASIQSMGNRIAKYEPTHFDLVVVDEAHHALADSWQRVLMHFSPAKVLGVTATPDRGDKKNLGKFFERVAAEISLLDLINQGFLSRIVVRSLPLRIDLSGVRTTAGDYNDSDLGNRIEPYLGAVADALRDEAAFRRTLVFLPLIVTSKKLVSELLARGVKAAHIDGESPDRKEILADYAAGKYDVLCNAMLLTEGFDDPGIDCIVVLRPTRSRALYSQMVGRGSRISLGKINLLLLDFLWTHEKHSLIRPAHLVAETQEIADDMTEITQKAGGGATQPELDLQDLLTETQAKREKKLREALKAQQKRQARTIDPVEFCLSLGAMSLVEYEPTMPWEGRPASAAQLKVLAQNGVNVGAVKSIGHASKLIALIFERRKLNLASPKQVALLRRMQHPSPEIATATEARAFIGAKFSERRAA